MRSSTGSSITPLRRFGRPVHGAILYLLVAWTTTPVSAQSRWWVSFKDKGPVHVGARVETSHLSPRALARRMKVRKDRPATDESDRPVFAEYIRRVTSLGPRLHSASRWLNAISVSANAEMISSLRSLPFVQDIRPVRRARRGPPTIEHPPTETSLGKQHSATGLDYGLSRAQNDSLRMVALHELGVIGTGVFVGMLDDGFNNHRVHPGLRAINVVAEYDFVQRDSNTSVEPGEYATQGFHGASTMSVLAGYDPGELVGGAFGAMLALGKTEVDSVEIVAEEDKYVEGLEWLESLGVDIISTSLGYIDWYTFEDLDGQTAITTKAARILAAKGVLLVTAMGNEGQFQSGSSNTGTLIAPADADSIISVGAVQPSGNLASFSSTGPTFDGRVKPEVVAQGTTVRVAIGTAPEGYTYSQGTSFATPLTAAAAALVLSAHPEATPMQIRTALMNTAVQRDDGTARTISYPNNYYGWGRVDAYRAALSLGPVISNTPIVRFEDIDGQPSLLIFIRAAGSTVLDYSRLAVYARRTGETVFERYPLLPGAQNGLHVAQIPVAGPGDTSFVGYVTVAEEDGPELRRPSASGLFELHPTSDSVLGIFPPVPSDVPADYVLEQNYPNPFNSTTIIVFRSPVSADVKLEVYSLLGEKVRTLFSGRARLGTNSTFWHAASDDRGFPLSTGVYILRLTAPQNVLTRKMLLVK